MRVYSCLIASALILSPARVRGQTETWADIFHRLPRTFEADSQPPLLIARCDRRLVPPDSVWLMPDTMRAFINAKVWHGRQQKWEPIAAPTSGPPLGVRVRRPECDDSGQPFALLVERDSVFARVDLIEAPKYTAVFGRRHGVLTPLTTALTPAATPAEMRELRAASARRAAAAEEERRRSAAAAEDKRRQQLLARGWPNRMVEAVIGGRVAIGMSSEMVRASWGKPDHINTTINASGRSEQWVYGESQYVYLENGIVTSLQTSR